MNQGGEDTGNDIEEPGQPNHEDKFSGNENLRKYKMLSVSERMESVFREIDYAASTHENVFITAETGTGKELVSKAIHDLSPRKDKPFNPINCSALPRELLENELFGHKKGAYTGAYKMEPGILEISDGGTVFLDEIGDMDISLQPKLLRAIQEKGFRQLGGGSVEKKIDVRFIAATSKSHDTLINPKKFHPPLYYRLNVFDIYMPPLREREEDLPLLIEYFIYKSNKEHKKGKTITPEVICLAGQREGTREYDEKACDKGERQHHGRARESPERVQSRKRTEGIEGLH